MTAENTSITNEPITNEPIANQNPSITDEAIANESLKIKRQQQAIKKLQDELKENQLVTVLKEQRDKLEVQRTKNKFILADIRFKDCVLKNEKLYLIPKHSCIITGTNDKKELKYLLDDRGRKSSWLKSAGQNTSSILEERRTLHQLTKKDEYAEDLWTFLENKGLTLELSDQRAKELFGNKIIVELNKEAA